MVLYLREEVLILPNMQTEFADFTKRKEVVYNYKEHSNTVRGYNFNQLSIHSTTAVVGKAGFTLAFSCHTSGG